MYHAMIGTVTAPFHKAFADEVKMTVPSIRALIDICRERRQTGVIRLVSAGGKSLYLLLKHGDILNSYAISSQAWKSVLSEQCDAWIDSAGDAHAKFIRLSPQGLLICKLLIQNADGEIETFTRPADIGEYLEARKKIPDLSLVQLEWENSVGAVLFSGSSESPYSLFVSPGNLYDQTDIAPAILDPERPHCTVTMFGFDQSVEAWQEHLLRHAFADICEHTLSQFQMLTGRSLIDNIIRLIAAFASRRSLDIGIASRKVVDGEIFSSPQQAADSYRLLLTEMFQHFSGITGTRLLSSTLRGIVANLPVHERAVIAAFSLFPEGYIYERRV
jgi:hypothetical protein